ncbi:MAG: 5-(carboxyamino)imidazole ribonucleotide mutase [Erysipelothrix sp.]|nr:5-(carboxyamino)imidazole ribonucleotide mutase [Erysipelothrix sp.]
MKVSIIMGSKNDDSIMHEACLILDKFGVSYEKKVVSAHRTPLEMVDYAKTLNERGFNVVIAGAGGAAHLPGMVAAITDLPVIGVPIETKALKGVDSLLSIVQMPKGIPVLTVSINGAANAGIAAVQICSIKEPSLKEKIIEYKKGLSKTTWEQQFDE